jgi:hypothetical protein
MHLLLRGMHSTTWSVCTCTHRCRILTLRARWLARRRSYAIRPQSSQPVGSCQCPLQPAAHVVTSCIHYAMQNADCADMSSVSNMAVRQDAADVHSPQSYLQYVQRVSVERQRPQAHTLSGHHELRAARRFHNCLRQVTELFLHVQSGCQSAAAI